MNRQQQCDLNLRAVAAENDLGRPNLEAGKAEQQRLNEALRRLLQCAAHTTDDNIIMISKWLAGYGIDTVGHPVFSLLKYADFRQWVADEIKQTLVTFDPSDIDTPAQTLTACALALARVGVRAPEITWRMSSVLT